MKVLSTKPNPTRRRPTLSLKNLNEMRSDDRTRRRRDYYFPCTYINMYKTDENKSQPASHYSPNKCNIRLHYIRVCRLHCLLLPPPHSVSTGLAWDNNNNNKTTGRHVPV